MDPVEQDLKEGSEGFSCGKVISQLQAAPEVKSRMNEVQDQKADSLPAFDSPHSHTRCFAPPAVSDIGGFLHWEESIMK